MSYGGRASTVMSQLSTEKPGTLFKELTPTVFHEVITEPIAGPRRASRFLCQISCPVWVDTRQEPTALIDKEYLKTFTSQGRIKS